MQEENVLSDHGHRRHWLAMAIVVMVLLTTVVIGITADWRAFVALPLLLVELRRLVEVVGRTDGGV